MSSNDTSGSAFGPGAGKTESPAGALRRRMASSAQGFLGSAAWVPWKPAGDPEGGSIAHVMIRDLPFVPVFTDPAPNSPRASPAPRPARPHGRARDRGARGVRHRRRPDQRRGRQLPARRRARGDPGADARRDPRRRRRREADDSTQARPPPTRSARRDWPGGPAGCDLRLTILVHDPRRSRTEIVTPRSLPATRSGRSASDGPSWTTGALDTPPCRTAPTPVLGIAQLETDSQTRTVVERRTRDDDATGRSGTTDCLLGVPPDAPSGPPPRRPRSAFLTADRPEAPGEPPDRGPGRPWRCSSDSAASSWHSPSRRRPGPERVHRIDHRSHSHRHRTPSRADRSRFGSVARAFGRGAIMLGTVGTALMATRCSRSGSPPSGCSGPCSRCRHRTRGRCSTPASRWRCPRPMRCRPLLRPRTRCRQKQRGAGRCGRQHEQGAARSRPRRLHRRRPRFPSRRASTPSGPRSPWALGPWRTPWRDGSEPGTTRPSSRRRATRRDSLMDGTGTGADPGGRAGPVLGRADRSAWSVTIIGARFGATASYSSAVGTVRAADRCRPAGVSGAARPAR